MAFAGKCRFSVDGTALAVIQAPNQEPRAIELDGKFPAGQYTVMAEILVNNNAMNAEIEKIPVTVGGGS